MSEKMTPEEIAAYEKAIDAAGAALQKPEVKKAILRMLDTPKINWFSSGPPKRRRRIR